MAVFTFIPSSANEVVYLSKTISADDFAALCLTNSSVKYSYIDLSSNPYLSLFGPTLGNYRVTSDNLPYTALGNISGSSLYWQGVVFTCDVTNNAKRILVSLSPNFDLYFDDFNLVLYFIGYVSCSFTFQYLDDDSNLVTVPYVVEDLGTAVLSSLKSTYPDLIDDNYYNYALNNKYFTDFNGVNTYFPTGLTTNTTYKFYKVTLSFNNLNKTKINTILISQLLNYNTDNSLYPRIFPYVKIGSDIPAYIKSDQDQVYSEQLALQREISQKLSDIQNKVDVISGPPSQQQQAAIDQVDNQLATEYDELQEQLDIIHSPEMPTELPTEDFSNLETQANIIDTYLGDLNLLNIFNVIVPAGCAGFLIYIVLRRF